MAGFATTRWSLIAASRGEEPQARAALSELLQGKILRGSSSLRAQLPRPVALVALLSSTLLAGRGSEADVRAVLAET